MRSSPVTTVLPAALATIGVAILILWSRTGTIGGLAARVPGLDGGMTPGSTDAPPAVLDGKLTRSDGQPGDSSSSWSGFRGDNLDGICNDGVPLARQWPKDGPKTLWQIDVGEGYAGAAVRAGRAYVLDYDRASSTDALRCLSLDDGKEIWRFSYPVVVKRNHGMSRTVPVVTEQYVVSLGPKCHVACLDRISGEKIWMLDLVRQFGATVPQWYAGQCPLVEDGRAILAPGGEDGLLMAVDCKTGEVLWKSPNPKSWTMTHSSITPMELGGRRMYVYCGRGGVVGVAASDGSILWETSDWKISIATCPSPVILGDGKIFFCGGYNAGALILHVKEVGDRLAAHSLVRLKAKQFGSTQQTPVLLDGCLYGVRENDRQLVCLDLEGKEVWSSGRRHKFGSGPYMIADGLIFVMDDVGVLTLAEATPAGYRQLARAEVFANGHDSWGPMAMVGGRLIVRDFTRMACLMVAEQ